MSAMARSTVSSRTRAGRRLTHRSSCGGPSRGLRRVASKVAATNTREQQDVADDADRPGPDPAAHAADRATRTRSALPTISRHVIGVAADGQVGVVEPCEQLMRVLLAFLDPGEQLLDVLGEDVDLEVDAVAGLLGAERGAGQRRRGSG